MTTEQKRKILQKIVDTEAEIEQLKSIRIKLCTDGYASATMSSGSGSRSYTKMDVEKITNTISNLTDELKSLRSMLAGGSANTRFGQIWTVYT